MRYSYRIAVAAVPLMAALAAGQAGTQNQQGQGQGQAKQLQGQGQGQAKQLQGQGQGQAKQLEGQGKGQANQLEGQGKQGQQTPNANMQRPNYPSQLYRQQDIAKSLNINENQANRLGQMTEQLQQQYQREYEGLSKLNETERFQRQQEINGRYWNEWQRTAKDVFDERQLNRYRQLNYQYNGFNSFYDPEVQKRLDLTERQRTDLRESVQWNNQQILEIQKLGGTDRERAIKQYQDYRKQNQERFEKFLTPDQRKAWNELTGDPYDFQFDFGK